MGNIDPIKREEGGSNVAESTATHVRATAGSTPRIEPKPSSNKIEVSDPSNPLSTGIPRILGPSGDGLQSLPDRRENGDLSNKPSRGGTRWQEEESGDVNSAVSNQTRHVSITGEDGHPEPATSGNEVSKTVDGTTNSPTTNVEPLVSHATRSTPNPIPTTTLDSLPLSTITPQPSVQTTYSVDQSTTGIVDVDKGSKSQGPKRCESRDSLLSVTERQFLI